MNHSTQTLRHSFIFLLLALFFILVGGVSADPALPPEINNTNEPDTRIEPYADIHAAIEMADDWETIATLAQQLPFADQARLSQAYLVQNMATLQREVVATADDLSELAVVTANELEEARAAERAQQVRNQQSNVLDADKLATPAGDDTTNRAAAILTVGDGCTYGNVQAAVDAAASGDTIRVQAKTWTGSLATVNINNKSLTIIGGYNSTCVAKTTDKTILDGNGTFDSIIEIYGGTARSVLLEDFELRGGRNDADYGGGVEISGAAHVVTLDEVFVIENSSTFGGGIHMTDNATLTLRDSSKVTLNSATQDGGGIFCTDGTINVEGNSYIGFFFIFVSEPNTADSNDNDDGSGGGIYADNCDVNLGESGFGGVILNSAQTGGGIYAINSSSIAMLTVNSSVSINSADSHGGGLYLASDSDIYVDHGIVASNSAGGSGGGIYAIGSGTIADFDSSAACTTSSCARLTNNSADAYGGGAYVASGAHLDLKVAYANGNSSGSLGSFVYALNDATSIDLDSVMLTEGSGSNYVIRLFDSSGGPHASLDNLTIAGVTGFTASDRIFGVDDTARLDVARSIIFDNSTVGLVDGDGDVTIDCSILSEPFAGSDNEVADPQFLDPAASNYHISRNSPAVDQCAGGYTRDIDYEARPNAILNVGTARRQLDDVVLTELDGRNAGQTQAIIVYPEELTAPLGDLLTDAVRLIDFGRYVWIEMTPDQARAVQFPHVVVENFGRIQFNNFSFDPLQEGEPTRGAAHTNSNGDALYFVQLRNPATDQDLDTFESNIKLIQYYPFNTYLVWGSESDLADLQSRSDNIRWTGVFHSDYRLAWQLAEKLPQRGSDVLELDLYLLDDGELASVGKTIERLGGQLVNTMNRHIMNENMWATIWQITLPANQVANLLTLPQLLHVDSTPVDQILDERSNQIIADNVPGDDPATGYATWLGTTGYDGDGVTVAVVDSGVDWDHPDLNVVSGNEYGGYSEAGEPGSDGGPDSNNDSRGSGHGTHVAGIVAGDGGTGTADGDGFIYGQGVAPGASLHAQDGIAEDSGADRETRVNDSATNADLSNNSWGADPGVGYNSGAANHDDWMLDAINNGTSPATAFLAVFAAGNAGNSGINDPGEAKNLLVVASSDSDRSNTAGGEAGDIDNISGFSGRGLAADGRIKPDVTAPGRNIISTQNTNGTTVSCDGGVGNPPGTSTQHSFCTGTSMASPHVAGAAALFTQFWRVRYNTTSNPHPSIVKAAIINTTDDLGGRPDGNEGWGRVNLDRMLNPTVPIVYYQTPDRFTDNGETWEIAVRPFDTSEPMRVTLYWDDAPGANNANPALVNDLYLRLQETNGAYWRGNVFAADGWSTTGGSNDTRNNVENVWIEDPNDTTYTINVIAQSLNGDAEYYNGDTTDQDWSLVCYNCDVVIEGTYDAGADEVYAQVGVDGAVCGHSTIVDAIAAAADGATIYIPAGDYDEVLGDVNKSVTLVSASNDCTVEAGSGQGAVEIDPNDAAGRTHGGIMRVSNSSTVILRHVRLEDGTANYGGAAYVDAGSTLILDNASLARGTAALNGGGLRVLGSAELLNNSWIYSSVTTDSGDGGGIAIGAAGVVDIRGGSDIGVFDGISSFPNQSADLGGGIFMSGGTLNVYDSSTIRNNSATTNGGGIYASNGATINFFDSATIGGGNVNHANSAAIGGGVYLTGSGTSLTLSTNNSVQGNTSSTNGAGIAVVEQATLNVDGANILDNVAANWGGGIYIDSNNLATAVTIQNGALIDGNSADLGGGIYAIDDNVSLDVSDSTLNNNDADWGGGARFNSSGTFTLVNSAITNNEATSGNGGGVSLDQGGTFSATDLELRANTASGSGGGLHNVNGSVTLTADTVVNEVSDNQAGVHGGGIYNSGNNTLRIDADHNQFNITNNTAGSNGGGVFVSSSTYFWPRGMLQINGNTATQNGGGVYVESATALIDDFGSDRPQMSGNTATNGDGGAAYVLNSTLFRINGVDIDQNDAQNGGGVYADNSAIDLITASLDDNAATVNGGGVAAVNGSILSIETTFTAATRSTACDPTTLDANNYCSMIMNNHADEDGGGIYVESSTLSAEYVAIVNNTNDGTGSAIGLRGTASGSLTSSLVAHNASSALSNTAVHIYIDASLDLTQNTIVDNNDLGVLYAAGATGNMDGNIIWGNQSRGNIGDNSPTCNNTQGSALAGGSGNISSDPLFVSNARGDYKLGAGSPSIDACATGPARDLDNVGRPQGASFDMGAFEGTTIPTAISLSQFGTTTTALALLLAMVGIVLVTTYCLLKRRGGEAASG